MKLTHGIKELDEFLGGFEPGFFIVLYGSRLCHTLSELLCVRAQLPNEIGGSSSSVIFVDGGNSFDPYAISFFSQLHNLDPKATLENIFVSRAFTAYQLTSLIFEKLPEALGKFGSRLIVVSDVTRLFLDPDVPKTEAQDVFNRLTLYLSDFASKNGVVVLATHVPRIAFRRSVFLNSALHGRAHVLLKLQDRRSLFRLALVKHPTIKPGYVEFAWNTLGNTVTLKEFLEV